MTNFQKLVEAKVDVFTSIWSDDFDAPKRDAERYERLLNSQSEYTDEQITKTAVGLYNGEITRAEAFGE
jgi:alpha-acetolactate decarboxylase